MEATIRQIRPVITVPDSQPHHEPHRTAPPPAHALVVALLETLLGRRALHQLRRHTSPDAFQRLVHHVDSGVLRRAQLGRIRTQMPTERSVEASATLVCDGRHAACVIRLDIANQAWSCTELAVLEPAGLVA